MADVTVAASPPETINVRRFVAFIAMIAGMFMAVLSVQIVGSSFKEIQAALGAAPDEVSWVLTAALIAEVIMIPLSARFSQICSTRIFFTVCAGGFTLASVGCAQAWDVPSMIAFRATQGFFGGGMMPMVVASLYTAIPRRLQVSFAMIFGMLGTSAVAIGPVVGGWITEVLSWEWLFLVNVPIGVVVVVVVGLLVDFDRPDVRLIRQTDFAGIVLAFLLLGSTLFVLQEGQRRDWFESSLILGCTVVAGITLVAFLVREFTAREPLVRFGTFRRSHFLVGVLLIGVFGGGLYVPIYLLPLYLGQVRGFDTATIGSITAVLGVSMVLSGVFAGHLVRYIGLGWTAALGFGLLAAGTILHAGLTIDSGFAEWALPQVLRGMGAPLAYFTMLDLSMSALPVSEVKHGSALFNLIMRLGAAVGLAIANTLLVARADLHYARIAESMSLPPGGGWQILGLVSGLLAGTLSPEVHADAVGYLTQIAQREALIMAFNDVLIGNACLLGMALLVMPVVGRIARTSHVRL